MVCLNCGMDIQENAAVCEQCGEPIAKPKRNFGKDFAWASLVLGIWSMIFYPYLYAPLAVIAAVVARRQDYRGKMPIVGIVLGLVALAGWAIFCFLI